ncbi:hypothetical protein HS048_34340 [Planomonospora sp. ID91781]|uniref:hypothetical protein n=1 Tax=Planomonospora sp. ID91781 TaxID=2738135 RepID=UPI0018C37DDF|nr:hypothetical protein [Planomonospora sp. ID91781]MBG0825766.1 hypothetical protein [Planomonospora sp. ID91781]
MDDNPPAELVEAQRALDAAMRACDQLATELPAWSAIQAGEPSLIRTASSAQPTPTPSGAA